MPDLSRKDMEAIVSRVTESIVRELSSRPGGSAADLGELVGAETAWKITYDTSSEAISSIRGIAAVGEQAWKITYDTSGDAAEHLRKIADISDVAWKITYDTSDASIRERLREVERLGQQAWKITYDTSD